MVVDDQASSCAILERCPNYCSRPMQGPHFYKDSEGGGWLLAMGKQL